MAPERCPRCSAPLHGAPKFCGECGQRVQGAPSDRTVEDVLRRFLDKQVAARLVAGGGAVAEERRLVTAVFADLSGFSVLASRLDPEQLLEVVRPVISGLADVAGRHGGYVDKFAGDALLCLFGAPVTREDDADRALRMALEMHEELPRMQPWADVPLELHVGISSGHVIAHVSGGDVRLDYSVLGATVVLAQRLESLAPAGQTYVGETTRRLVRGGFELAPLPPLQVKGYAEPVRAYRLLGESRPEDGVLPAAKRQLVGRDAELQRGREVLRAAAPPLLAVVGEPGTGKSRLVAEMRRGSVDEGVLWLTAHCAPQDAAAPYAPVAQWFRAQPGLPADAARDGARLLEAVVAEYGLEQQRSSLQLLLQPGRAENAAATPQALSRELHAALLSWLRALSERQPVVLLLEDAHWADPSTLSLLPELLRGLTGAPVACCVTARPEAEASVVPADHDGTSAEVLRLDPLEPAEVRELLEQLLDGGVPGDLELLVRERAGGNPFFVEELVRSLQDGGVLVDEGPRWRLRPGWDGAEVPPTVEGLLSARLDQLPAHTTAVLAAAAVIGRVVPLDVLRAVVPVDEVELQHALADLLAAHVLVAAPSSEPALLRFSHALVQEVAEGRVLRRRRRVLHALVAEAVRARQADMPEADDLLARHLFLAGAGAEAVEALVRVGLRNKQVFSNAEALVQLARAAQVAREQAPELLPDVLAEVADLHELVGDYDRAQELFEELRGLGDVRGWVGCASTLRRRGRYAEALDLLDAAATHAHGPDLRGLDLERSWTLSGSGRLVESIAAAQAGLARVQDPDRVGGLLLLQLARAETEDGRGADAVTHLEQALAALPEDDLRARCSALRLLGGALESCERLDDAAQALQQGLALADRTGDVEEAAGCLINLGLVELGRGELGRADEAVRRALGHFELLGHRAGAAIAQNNLAEVMLHSDRLDEAQAHAERALAQARSIDNRLVVVDATVCLALVAARRGRHAEAVELASTAADLAEREGYAAFAERARAVVADELRAAQAPS